MEEPILWKAKSEKEQKRIKFLLYLFQSEWTTASGKRNVINTVNISEPQIHDVTPTLKVYSMIQFI